MRICTRRRTATREMSTVGVPADKFKEQVEGEKEWAAEHVVGLPKVSAKIS